ncbi:CFIA complex component Rna14 [Metarhizium album ARSEF 1941]|uniref:mRNA 3'-end-processing protein RNA14 n=1 Tax=Metarhizium album (strain ARSEF 1941) TaxID=1081103 RepID=A0A0B2WIY7_METAS|nr:CFIA complex component Rna14 [Metarhizium album ARSEF 1941]KHN93803.1 CFIA complex component Rna14 [Metarhizium album ARSEF 1941]
MATDDTAWEAVRSGVEYDPLAQPSADLDQSEETSEVLSEAAECIDENEEDQDDGGEYDPESVGLDRASHIPDKSASGTPSQRSANKPKMSGGFLVEASDDEEEDNESPLPGGRKSATANVNQTSNEATLIRSADTLPHVPLGLAGVNPANLLEARIREDPRGDMDAWINLMADHKRRGRLDQLRLLYNRFLDVFPQAADIWVEWIEMELNLDNFVDAEQLFGRCLMSVPNVKLWTVYLNYIRRRNDLTNDATGQARRTVTQSYEFVIDNIGVDRDSGSIWQDYVQFIKNGPGQVGGTGWQDQQKMDQLRKAYHRAITVPMSTVNTLWKEYDQFEMGLNKITGRKFIQERSPGYMSAKSANIALDNITRNLKRENLPRLPPAQGFDGHEEFHAQVELWKKWISWELEDPLVLKDDEPKVYKQRILYCYKQALMALRFWPELWVNAAAWCFEADIRENDKVIGTEMLLQGISANPESVLLAFKHADHVEASYPEKEGDKFEYAKAVRKPYDAVLDTLYKMGDKVKEREKLEVNTFKQAAANESAVQESIEANDDDDDDDDEDGDEKKVRKSPTEERIFAIQQAYAAESQLLSKTISYVWIAMARAMRRIQGKGNQTEGGLRKVFTDARQKGRLTSDVYVAVALLESVVYKDPVGAKIFERGARLFPNDAGFMIEYLKYLHSKDDTTNARVVFETCVNRLVSKPETLQKAKQLYAYFHKYESQYGELSQISKLEARMAELFPEDPKLSYFTSRYSSETFDPVAAPIIISKAVQMRPKQLNAVIEQPILIRESIPPPRQEHQSPRPQYMRATASPKRPFGIEDEDPNPPKRIARGVSPLKGAAGRRLDQQRRNQTSALPRDITFLVGILPPAHTYDATRLNPSLMVSLLHDTQLPDYASWKAKTGGQYRIPSGTHGRQASGDFGNRPISPYGRLAAASAGYRNSPLRPESSNAFAANIYAPPPDASGATAPWQPPPAGVYGIPPPAGQYGGYRY